MEKEMSVVEVKRLIKSTIVKDHGSISGYLKSLTQKDKNRLNIVKDTTFTNYLMDKGSMNYPFLANMMRELKIARSINKKTVLVVEVM